MGKIDFNCDMGEGIGNDALIMPFITSASIACGYHAGDPGEMYQAVSLAVKHKVSVGAHVSYFDKENFGRSEMNLPDADVYELIQQQLIVLKEITDLFDLPLMHVKPHGALYNQSAKSSKLARTIATAIKDFDKRLVLFGLSGSLSIREAESIGLMASNEVFADRTYQDDGSLSPRSQPQALIDDAEAAVSQVLQIIRDGTIQTVNGKIIPVVADTICIHGDGKHAVEFAKSIHSLLAEN